MRTLIKKLRATDDAEQAVAQLNEVKAYLDRLATKGIIHKNKAANLKSQLDKKVNALR